MAADVVADGHRVQQRNGRPRLVDADVVGTTIRPLRFAVEDHIAQSFSIAGLAKAFLMTYQDNEASVPVAAARSSQRRAAAHWWPRLRVESERTSRWRSRVLLRCLPVRSR